MPILRCHILAWAGGADSSFFLRTSVTSRSVRCCVPPCARALRSCCTVPASQSGRSTSSALRSIRWSGMVRSLDFADLQGFCSITARDFRASLPQTFTPAMARARRSSDSSPSTPACYAMVHPGLEEVAADEITRDLGGNVRKSSPGVVVFRIDSLDERVLRPRTTEDIFLLA